MSKRELQLATVAAHAASRIAEGAHPDDVYAWALSSSHTVHTSFFDQRPGEVVTYPDVWIGTEDEGLFRAMVAAIRAAPGETLSPMEVLGRAQARLLWRPGTSGSGAGG